MSNIVWSHTFSADAILTAAQLEQLKTDITSVVNGQLGSGNFPGGSVWDPEQVDDFSADAAEMKLVTSPGTPGSESLATDLALELRRLRYALAQLKFGNATDQGGALEWYERSPNLLSSPQNMLYNGSFELFPGAGSTTAPPGWEATGTPSTSYAQTAHIAGNGLGMGSYLTITGAGSANTGVQVTFPADALRPSTTYLVYAMAWATTGDTARILSTDGSANIDVETTSTTPVLLQGFFTTDATPTAVVLQLLAKSAADVANFDHVVVVPQVATPRESGYVAVLQQMEAVGTGITNAATIGELGSGDAGAAWTDGTVALDRALICPGSGYTMRVSARLGFSTSSFALNCRVRLFESTNGGSTWALRDGSAVNSAESAHSGTLSLFYSVPNATPGLEYRYKVTGSIASGTLTPQGAATGADQHSKSLLLIELIPGGM